MSTAVVFGAWACRRVSSRGTLQTAFLGGRYAQHTKQGYVASTTHLTGTYCNFPYPIPRRLISKFLRLDLIFVRCF